ncbi:U6 snRNA phosphodiesterase 1 [Megalopta genalis]|uniref:U6 snRNA phosphodiesterase 1 n=1 Tax=Megalopta genalis TaxID=115081 RepID=UPI003FD64CF2
MSGLGLISTYVSDSEDDEVDKDSIENKTNEVCKRLPLPGSIAAWKGVPHHEEVNDDPLEHDGRIRRFKHERGNWATLVYLHYEPSEDLLSWMQSVLKELPIKYNLFSEEFHISITRSLILKFHWIDSFVEEIKKLCEQISQFSLELLNVRAYCNEDRTRTFLGIECIDDKGILGQFVKNLNHSLAEYKLPPFYEDSSYHISFLWCLSDETAILNDLTPSLTNKLNQYLVEYAEDRYIHVKKVHLKIGNKLYAFQLK